MSARTRQRPAVKSYLTVDQWEHLRVRDVDLDGECVSIELPDLAILTHMGTLPNPLRDAIAKLDDAVKDETKLSSEEIRDQLLLQAYVIALQLRKPNLVEQLGVEAAQNWVLEKMPPQHRKRLWDVCIFHKTSEEIEASLGERMAKFRDNGGGPEPVGSGDANGESPE